jgi:hypothetical protein
MPSAVLQDALSVLDAVVVESPLKSRKFRGNSAIADARASEFNDTPSSNLLTAIFDSIRYLTTRKTAMQVKQVGWDRGRRVRGNLIYVTLSEGKVWVEYDGMEQGITKDLIAAGIPPERIVLAFLPEEQTTATA